MTVISTVQLLLDRRRVLFPCWFHPRHHLTSVLWADGGRLPVWFQAGFPPVCPSIPCPTAGPHDHLLTLTCPPPTQMLSVFTFKRASPGVIHIIAIPCVYQSINIPYPRSSTLRAILELYGSRSLQSWGEVRDTVLMSGLLMAQTQTIQLILCHCVYMTIKKQQQHVNALVQR